MLFSSVFWLVSFPSLTLFSYVALHTQAANHVHQPLETRSSSINQTYRTAYHFQPAKNWMNGPMRYKGLYHFFYQYNPKAAVWGNITWGHSVSPDLVNWTSLDLALVPSQPYDNGGCWSGSATILPDGKPVLMYTGNDLNNHETQNLAMPKNASDPFLKEWVKSPKNPLLAPNNVNRINATSFRDPTTAWLGRDGWWRVILGSQNRRRGVALLYRSKDFVHWIQAKHPLHSAKDTGMWECPDFFPVLVKSPFGVDTSFNGPNVRHVLKISLFDAQHDSYLIGNYDTIKDIFIPDKGFEDNNYSVLRYDYGKFYASKTFYDDAKKRRILWGWVKESSNKDDDIKKGWSGIQGIPRSIWLHESGKQLVQWPVVEIEKLRTNPVNWPSKVLKGGELLQVSGVTAAQADVEISFKVKEFGKVEEFEPSWKLDPQSLCNQKGAGAAVRGGLGPFGLLVLASKGLEEHTAVFFRVFKIPINNRYVVLMCSDQSRSSLNHNNDLTTYGAFLDMDPLHEQLSLRTLIDHSVVESFGGEGRACITARVYPTLAVKEDAHLYAFNNGTANVIITRLSAWSINKAQIN
ncbi:hypothetical protein L6164_003493 [Bauhinia variegata]|uniref:Uncharacterized protein n=1 Tax=Bauhinia variegata TaxID=167791 RepID=A0ACB9Q452_BAUVA|nr:hypothetical protein L6164_003493 [Bauhinia variegata]